MKKLSKVLISILIILISTIHSVRMSSVIYFTNRSSLIALLISSPRYLSISYKWQSFFDPSNFTRGTEISSKPLKLMASQPNRTIFPSWAPIFFNRALLLILYLHYNNCSRPKINVKNLSFPSITEARLAKLSQ